MRKMFFRLNYFYSYIKSVLFSIFTNSEGVFILKGWFVKNVGYDYHIYFVSFCDKFVKEGDFY